MTNLEYANAVAKLFCNLPLDHPLELVLSREFSNAWERVDEETRKGAFWHELGTLPGRKPDART